ncbi:hypothetical protein ANN_23273 [Periplaneta americana]|uniref:Ig-like domain-containing protein n=1 Tax=Periplaneta americana TaxID=6978 RepID=A0ABQ8SLS7_PERAM|nr:hypothetical protein ANN_23273 [Periplaneta americana]
MDCDSCEKNLKQVTFPDWEWNPGHLVSRPDMLTVTPKVHQEVHCLAKDGSSRRVDIIAIDRGNDTAIIIDPTVRFETAVEQPVAAHEEKKTIYDPTMQYFRDYYHIQGQIEERTHTTGSEVETAPRSEARAEILGGPDKFVKSGSSLRLTCVLKKSTEPPVYVFWYHESRMINYDMGRGVRVRHGRYTSELVVTEAHKHDSGNYSCVPSNAHPASISVHILNDRPMFGDVWRKPCLLSNPIERSPALSNPEISVATGSWKLFCRHITG